MNEPAVLLEVRDAICQLTLNRPETRNSIDDEIPTALANRLEEIRSIKGLRCVILTGSGGVFCGGMDFRSNLSEHLFDDASMLPHEAILKKMYAPIVKLLDVEIPIIAAMNGHAIGGGLGMGLLCDFRVVSSTAKYGANFVRLGVTSGLAISYLLPRIVGFPTAMELLLTGRLISGEEAERIRLAHYATKSDHVLNKAWELAREVAEAAPIAVRLMKKAIYRGIASEPFATLEYESHNMARTRETQDYQEGVRALLEKRSPKFTGL